MSGPRSAPSKTCLTGSDGTDWPLLPNLFVSIGVRTTSNVVFLARRLLRLSK